MERSPPIKGVTRQFREISTPTTGSGGGSTAVHMTNRSLRKLNPAYQHGTSAVPFAPGREGPAMADFFAEPLSLDFWKLRKSFVRTRSSALLVCPRCIGILIKKVTGSVASRLSPSQRVCLVVGTLLLIPLARPLQWFRAEGRRCASTLCACQSWGSVLHEAVGHAARRRHSRSQSPEIPGRIVSFIIAIGRSPPFFAVGTGPHVQ
jgi:hypothetical protein